MPTRRRQHFGGAVWLGRASWLQCASKLASPLPDDDVYELLRHNDDLLDHLAVEERFHLLRRQRRGFQFGLVNVAKHDDGESFALVNIIGNGIHDVSLFATDIMVTNIGVKLGGRHLYTNFIAGYQPGNELAAGVEKFSADTQRFATGVGVGWRFPVERGVLSCQPQPSVGVTYAAKIDKGETRLDFTLPAREVHNRVRGLSPAPGAWLEIDHMGKAERVKVLRTQLAEGAGPPGSLLDEALTIACGEGAVRVLEVQRSGKKPMSAGDFLRGFPLAPGTRLRGLG